MGLARWLLLPLHVAQVFTTAKSYAGNPILGSERLNRRGLHVFRTRLAHRMTAWRRRRLADRVSPEDRAFFAANGFVAKPDFLSRPTFEALVGELQRLQAPAREMQEGDAITRRIAIDDAVLRQAPALRELLRHPVLQGLCRYVASFDDEPLFYVQTIFGKAETRSGEDPQTALHMDTFHPTMKAWFFLHDVPDDAGPFTYVPGSHLMSARRLAWQKRQSILAARRQGGGAWRVAARDLPRFGWPQPRRFAVSGNTLVVGDTCGFHARAASSKATTRVEIYAYSRLNPYKPFTRLGVGALPGIGSQRVPIYWWLHDHMVRLGLTRPVWLQAGTVSPDSPRSTMPGE